MNHNRPTPQNSPGNSAKLIRNILEKYPQFPRKSKRPATPGGHEAGHRKSVFAVWRRAAWHRAKAKHQSADTFDSEGSVIGETSCPGDSRTSKRPASPIGHKAGTSGKRFCRLADGGLRRSGPRRNLCPQTLLTARAALQAKHPARAIPANQNAPPARAGMGRDIGESVFAVWRREAAPL